MKRAQVPRQLADFLAYKTAAGLRPRSVEWYEERLRPILAELGPLPDHAALLEYLLAWKARTQPSQGHYRGVLVAVRTYLRHYGSDLNIPLPAVPRYEGPRLSANEVTHLLAVTRGYKDDGTARKVTGRDYAMIMLFVDSGIRSGELTSLTWADVDIGEARLSVNGKGGHRRFAYFGVATAKALRSWRKSQPKHTERVFCTRDATPLTRRNVFRIVRLRGKRAGLHLSPHMFRRTFATEWVKAGGNILALQRLLGHSTLEMSRRYVSMAETDLALEAKGRGVLDGILKKTRKRGKAK